MRRILFAILFCVSILVWGAPIEQSPIESKVFVHAHVQKVGGELIEDDTRVTGFVNVGDEATPIEEDTWIIPNKLGTGFEIAVGFKSIPLHLQHFDLEVTFPEMTLPSGEKRSRMNRPIDISGHDGKYVWLFAFYFDFPYETTPGDWNIKIRSKGNLIHTSTFTVIAF